MGKRGPKPLPLDEVLRRIHARLDKSGGEDACWPFADSKTYATIQARGLSHQPILVHRLICEEAHGPAPDGMTDVMHSCDNPPCANPRHVRWCTTKENVADAMQKGRWKIGGDYRRFLNG